MNDASNRQEKILCALGFSFKRGGAHTARTIMLDELSKLFPYVGQADAPKSAYEKAIIGDNCLGKRSGKTRALTFHHLVDLYALNPSVALFRTMRFFWQRDAAGQPLIALLCAYARDSVLRSASSFILSTAEGATVSRKSVETQIDDHEPGRFSEITLKSTAQNIDSSFTKSGHLTGRVKKIRTLAIPTAGSVAYALFLGYLAGERGQALFNSEYVKLLDCSAERAMELAEVASRKGWIVFKRIGSVVEVLFPKLIPQEETENLHE